MSYKIKHYAIIAGCLLGMVSCQEEELIKNSSNGNVTILARMDDGIQTRTCVDNSSSGDASGILWSPKDQIGVYGDKGTKNALFEAANTGNVAEAEFNGTLASGEYPTYAYYPYGADNATSEITALKGNLKLEQTFDMTTGKLEGDYKVGTPTFKTYEGRYEFAFEHLFSLLKFDIDATGTALEGDKLEKIILTLPEGRRLGGEFTFDATSKAVTWTGDATGANELIMVWSDMPALANGKSYTGYITCAPDICQGDDIKITILTQKFKAEFTRTALVDFAANTCYTFPLSLENYEGDMEVTNRPVFTSFSFEAKNNAGKILDKKLVFNGSATRPVDNVTEVLTIDGETITGCIPYLYDFNLRPTFEVPEGMVVTVGGTSQVSGESEQNFSKSVTYTVSNSNGTESRDYTVTVTNSGLPVVVLTQSGGGTESWAEAGINVRSKDSEWVENDKFTVYKADGTADVTDALCGIRLRGNSTQNFPKKPFAIKLVSKASVLGMPKHKRWVLLANWMDRTMLRNAVALNIAHRVDSAYVNTEGDYTGGVAWSPRGTSVEVIMDGRHVGNYFLCEQIKIDGDRVDIKDCIEDIIDDGNASPTMADCGYLLEFDDNYDELDKFRTGRGLPCMFKDEVSQYSSDIFNQVKARIEAVEANLEAGNYETAYNDLDINSVIDYFFIQELTFNDEYKHPKSVYMLIDGDGKLTAGPVWDFDWQTFINYDKVQAMNSKYGGTYSCRNTNEWLYGASKLAEWHFIGGYDYENDMPYMWYPLLFKDANFRTRVQERWTVIYPQLTNVVAKIDEFAAQNKVSDLYNYAMWPLTSLKNSVGSAFNGDEDMSFDEAIATMKQAYTERLNWMNTQITGGKFVIDAK